MQSTLTMTTDIIFLLEPGIAKYQLHIEKLCESLIKFLKRLMKMCEIMH